MDYRPFSFLTNQIKEGQKLRQPLAILIDGCACVTFEKVIYTKYRLHGLLSFFVSCFVHEIQQTDLNLFQVCAF